jgi:DNA polymerase elongation subunit (family B)
MEHVFKLFEFNVNNQKREEWDPEEDEPKLNKDNGQFSIQMFGINEVGETASIIIEGFQPFFYLKVDNNWGQTKKVEFFNHLKLTVGRFFQDSIIECKLIEKKKLYGFDAGKKHRFIEIKFANINVYNKVKNLWYEDSLNEDGEKERKLIKNGYRFGNSFIELYEANIPPLLRFFHIREISPSGWIAMPIKKTVEIKGSEKTTTCNYEFITNYKNVIPLNYKEDRVPYKIMSFDIEASSSHGDFPVPIKSYKKLATNIVDYFAKLEEITTEQCKINLRQIIKAAFGFCVLENIDKVYPKEPIINEKECIRRIENWFKTKVREQNNDSNEHLIESLFENANKALITKEKESDEGDSDDDDSDDEIIEEPKYFKIQSGFKTQQYKNKESTIVDIICDKKFDRDGKINELIRSLRNHFPALEGDKVTFIGSTFLKYGEQEPYLNHCIALNSCEKVSVSNSLIESYETERDVLVAWTELVQKENPDIIIGYNIFSFDYEFMFRRSQELSCVQEFLKLSRNKDELCATLDYKNPSKIDIDRSSTTLASGTYELAIIKMNGRLQVDMLNWFRRTENLTSYKLDYVGSHFIGDDVISLLHECRDKSLITRIQTNNMTGLQAESFIHFEEINHSSDYYKEGQKFKVINVCKEEGWFEILGHENPYAKKVKWGLAKDDVTPKDIFRMTNEGPASRAIIAKYCIQDCNLVHYLFNKVDVATDLVEMSKLCSIPMSFLIFRGQGIKLTSYVAKKCREKGVLMPCINKGSKDDGYEGAIVLQPKCGLYLDDPVCVGDFASLYPSSMLSENLCPSSKVWTKVYDLAGNLVLETGEKNGEGIYIYDNISNYEYVDIRFDTYRWIRKNPKARAEKVKSGYKICRFAQPLTNSDGQEEKAIMPSILQELLKARKDTRKQIPQTDDEFMKNVLDKRQLAYKVTANSLYGQLGAKTSTFYEPDIAASTTATGRLLLTFAKRVVEECYADTNVETKHGFVNTKAEYVYGDSVANYTPVYVKVNDNFDILTIEQLAVKYGNNNWIKCLEPGKQEKEFCELEGVYTWTEKGWTKLYRVIRHELASHKKMIRVLTHTGCVDVTDDHSLIKSNGQEISPKECILGQELLHHPLPVENVDKLYETVGKCERDDEFNYIVFTNMIDAAKCCYELNKEKKLFYIEECCTTDYDGDGTNAYMVSSGIKTKKKLILYTYYKPTWFEKRQQSRAFWNGQKIECVPLKHPTNKYFGNYEWVDDDDENSPVYIDNRFLESDINKIVNIREIPYEGYVYDLTTDNHHFAAGVGNMIVHNTDSVFFKFNLTDKETGEKIIGEKALELSIEIAQEACHNVSKVLKQPHDFEYEKTFMPFCLLSKKRYVSIKYELDPKKGKRNEMGIVLKRRDNAPIVKDIYGGVIDILMKEKNIQKAIDYVNKCLQELVDGNVPIEKLIITKSLRSFYKNPQGVAHKVLADRISQRDPGNKPTSGDRIAFVYIVNKNVEKGKKMLQGDKIETPGYIKDNKLQIDYSFYITNQIMKPLLQLFGLVLEDIWMSQKPPRRAKVNNLKKEIENINATEEDEKKCEKKISKIKDKEVQALIFDKYLRDTNNAKLGNQSIAKMFQMSKK